MLFPRLGSCLSLFVAVVNLLHVVSAQVKTVDELFQVSFDTSVGGNCAQWGEDRLNDQLSDAYDLAQVGLDVVTYATDASSPLYDEAVRILATWFNNLELSAAQYTTIGNSYQAVHDFLGGVSTKTNAGQSTAQPLLVCGDSWVLRKEMTDQAYGTDATGATVPLTKFNGSPFPINGYSGYVQQQALTTQAIGTQAYPYWSAPLGTYLFDRMYTQSDPTSFVCTTGSLGQSIQRSQLPRNILILCDSVFTGSAAGRRLHSVTATCANANLFVTENPTTPAITRITNVAPEAGTMFHELFHLVLGNANTIPKPIGEVYDPLTMLGFKTRWSTTRMTTAESLMNPETFSYVAIGFDYTINAPLQDNYPVEFYTQYCSYQS